MITGHTYPKLTSTRSPRYKRECFQSALRQIQATDFGYCPNLKEGGKRPCRTRLDAGSVLLETQESIEHTFPNINLECPSQALDDWPPLDDENREEDSELDALLHRRFMTICAAAFAEKSKAIVAVTDKAITYGSQLAIQSDTTIKKVISIGQSGWHVLLAGNPSFATAVVRKAERLMTTKEFKSCATSEVSMMSCMEHAFTNCWEALAEKVVLQPSLLTTDLWRKRGRGLQPLPKEVVEKVNARFEKFGVRTTLLVIGFDYKKISMPHIFTIGGTGQGSSHDLMGFNAVGIGQHTAMGRMMFLEVDRDNPLDRNLYDVFDSKANAEMTQGVGYASDIYVLVRGRRELVEVRRDIKELMDDTFTWEINSPFERLNPDKKERPKRPDPKWMKKIQSYASEILTD